MFHHQVECTFQISGDEDSADIDIDASGKYVNVWHASIIYFPCHGGGI